MSIIVIIVSLIAVVIYVLCALDNCIDGNKLWLLRLVHCIEGNSSKVAVPGYVPPTHERICDILLPVKVSHLSEKIQAVLIVESQLTFGHLIEWKVILVSFVLS